MEALVRGTACFGDCGRAVVFRCPSWYAVEGYFLFSPDSSLLVDLLKRDIV